VEITAVKNQTVFSSLFLTALLLLSGSSQVQALTVEWDAVYGGLNLDEAYGMAQTPDSGYVLTGFTSSEGSGGSDLLLLRIDLDGNEDWSRTFGGADSDWGFDIVVTPDSHLITVGFSSSFSTSADAYIIKTDLSGNPVWTRVFGGPAGDYAYGVALAPDGGYVLAGETYSFGSGLSDVYVIKVNSDGVLEWSKFYGGSNYDWGQAITPLAEGGYVVAGFTNSFGSGNYDAYVLRLDADGDSVWAGAYGTSTFDGARAVVQSDDASLLIAGVTNRGPIKNNDAYLLGIDLDGQLLWETVAGGVGSESVSRVLNLANSSMLAVGESSSTGSGAEDFFLLQFSGEGDSLQSLTYGASATDKARAVAEYFDVGVMVAGFSRSFGSQSQVYVVRVNHDYLCGDAAGDGSISLSDAVFLIQYIFAGGPAPFPLAAGDADCSGDISLSDAVYLIQYIFAGGPAPCADCPPSE
jgi:uncharacterized delta-60 repeat protein